MIVHISVEASGVAGEVVAEGEGEGRGRGYAGSEAGGERPKLTFPVPG